MDSASCKVLGSKLCQHRTPQTFCKMRGSLCTFTQWEKFRPKLSKRTFYVMDMFYICAVQYVSY